MNKACITVFITFFIFFSGCLPVSFPVNPSGRLTDNARIDIHSSYNTFVLTMDSSYEGDSLYKADQLSTCASTGVTFARQIFGKFELRAGISSVNANTWNLDNFYVLDLGVKFAPMPIKDPFVFSLDFGTGMDLMFGNSGLSAYAGITCNYSLLMNEALSLDAVLSGYASNTFEEYTADNPFFGGMVYWLYGGFEFIVNSSVGLKIGGGVYRFYQESYTDSVYDYSEALSVDVNYGLKTNPFISAAIIFDLPDPRRGAYTVPVKKENYTEQAFFYYNQGKYNVAESIVLKELSLHSDDFDLNRLAGYIYFKLGFKGWAIGYFKKALALRPLDASVALRIEELNREAGIK